MKRPFGLVWPGWRESFASRQYKALSDGLYKPRFNIRCLVDDLVADAHGVRGWGYVDGDCKAGRSAPRCDPWRTEHE